MKIHKLHTLSIAICCFVIALCSETKGMERQEVIKGEISYKTNIMMTLEHYMDMEPLEIKQQKSLGSFVIFPLDVQMIILSKVIEVSYDHKFDKSLCLNSYFLKLMGNEIACNPHMFLWILEAAAKKPFRLPDLLSGLLPDRELKETFESIKQNPLNFFSLLYYIPLDYIPSFEGNFIFLFPLIDNIIGLTASCFERLRPEVQIHPILTSPSPVKAFLKSAYTSFLPKGVQETLEKGYQAFSWKNPQKTDEWGTDELLSWEENGQGKTSDSLLVLDAWEENNKIKVEKCDWNICDTQKKANCNEWTLSLSIPSLLKLSANEDVFAFFMEVLEYIEESAKKRINNTAILPKRNFMEFWHDVNQERVGSNYQALHDKKDLYRHADVYRAFYWKEYVFQGEVSHHISNDEQWLIVYAFSQRSFDLAKKETKSLRWRY